MWVTPLVAKALDLVKTKANRERRHPSRYCVVPDLESGQLYDGLEVAPCLKRNCGHLFWSLQHGRVLNLRELCRLQGLDIHEMIVQGISCSDLEKMLVKGSTCTMIARVLASGLQALDRASGIGVNVVADDTSDGSLTGYDSCRGALGPGGFPVPVRDDVPPWTHGQGFPQTP